MPRYSHFAILLHWIIAVFIAAAFGLGFTMVNIHGITPAKLNYFSWHKWIGVTVLGLACIRLLWRLYHPAPPYSSTMPEWQKRAAHGLHLLLYVLMFAVPISGYFYTLAAGVPVVYLRIIPLPVLIEPNPEIKDSLKMLHIVLTWVLATCILMHVAAALKHLLIDKDDIFKRMLISLPLRKKR
jgi:cytochrome b561